MITIEARIVEAVSGRPCYGLAGIVIHSARGNYISLATTDLELEEKMKYLREGGGWWLKDIEPEIYEYVRKNYPEELI